MISVLMATYRGERPEFLHACLESLERQTRPADQIVLVKDGELGTALEAVVARFAHLPLRAVLYNGGQRLGGALAFGLQYCEHELVARMDSDDLAVPQRFARQLAFLQQTGAAVVGGAIAEFCETPDQVLSVRTCPAQVMREHVRFRNPFNHMTVMFRKSAIIKAGSYRPLEGFEDWYLWLRLFAAGALLRNEETVLVYARTDSAFLSRRSGPRYALREVGALWRFKKERLLSWSEFCKNLLVRLPARLVPKRWLETIYRKLLR